MISYSHDFFYGINIFLLSPFVLSTVSKRRVKFIALAVPNSQSETSHYSTEESKMDPPDQSSKEPPYAHPEQAPPAKSR